MGGKKSVLLCIVECIFCPPLSHVTILLLRDYLLKHLVLSHGDGLSLLSTGYAPSFNMDWQSIKAGPGHTLVEFSLNVRMEILKNCMSEHSILPSLFPHTSISPLGTPIYPLTY